MSDQPQYPSYPGSEPEKPAGPPVPPPPAYGQTPPPPPTYGQEPPAYGQTPPPNFGSAYPPPPPGGFGPPAPGGYNQPPGNNQKALWSMILGILSLVCCGLFTGIPAIILSNIAKREIAESGGRQTGDGMAKAGLILGIIGIVFTVLYAAFVLIGIAADS